MRKISFAPGEYYHIYNRGVDKRTIFHDEKDYLRFLALMYLSNTERNFRVPEHIASNPYEAFTLPLPSSIVDVCAYCLMPNHFHFLLREKQEKGISTFMHKLSTAYTMYFNARNERNGSLFQGTFKAEHSADDRYLKYLIAYIHLNPVKLVESKWREEGIKNKQKTGEYVETYPYSSFKDFSGMQRPENKILSRGALPKYFPTPISFKENMQEWLLFTHSNEARLEK